MSVDIKGLLQIRPSAEVDDSYVYVAVAFVVVLVSPVYKLPVGGTST